MTNLVRSGHSAVPTLTRVVPQQDRPITVGKIDLLFILGLSFRAAVNNLLP